VLTKLMDIFATVGLTSQESTVLVSTPFKFKCSINMTNHLFILHVMESARTKGPPVTRHWMADGPGPADLVRLLYIMLSFFRAF